MLFILLFLTGNRSIHSFIMYLNYIIHNIQDTDPSGHDVEMSDFTLNTNIAFLGVKLWGYSNIMIATISGKTKDWLVNTYPLTQWKQCLSSFEWSFSLHLTPNYNVQIPIKNFIFDWLKRHNLYKLCAVEGTLDLSRHQTNGNYFINALKLSMIENMWVNMKGCIICNQIKWAFMQ